MQIKLENLNASTKYNYGLTYKFPRLILTQSRVDLRIRIINHYKGLPTKIKRISTAINRIAVNGGMSVSKLVCLPLRAQPSAESHAKNVDSETTNGHECGHFLACGPDERRTRATHSLVLIPAL